MAAVAPSQGPTELIFISEGIEHRTTLVLDRYRLGRGPANEIAFPADARLSREHLAIEKAPSGWQITDLQSSNGTRVNGERISSPTKLRDGDRIAAGNQNLLFRNFDLGSGHETIVSFHSQPITDLNAVSMNLQRALNVGIRPERLNSSHLSALLRAGRELASYRTLDELFEVILEVSLEAVGAPRGVLMTKDYGTLTTRSARGAAISISSTVRDRVIAGESLIVQDTGTTEDLAHNQSILAAHVRSILAVPLQTERGVFGLIYLDSPDLVRKFTPDDLSLLTVMANIAGIRIEHARLLEVERAEREMARELDHAAEIQRQLLPSVVPNCAHLDIAAYNFPCRKVGGDYYDFWTYPDGKVAVVVADVSGKGMPAALLMANLQAITHVVLESPVDLAGRVCRLNRAVATNTPIASFITFFICVIDALNQKLTYCNAGHNPPLLLRRSGEAEQLAATGMVLGLLPQAQYEEVECGFHAGDGLLLFSDGVTEACRADVDEEFGEERLLETFRRFAAEPAEQVIERIKSELAIFSSGIPAADDVTLAVVRRV